MLPVRNRSAELPERLDRMLSIGIEPGDPQDLVHIKRLVVAALWVSHVPNAVFTVFLFLAGAPWAAAALVGMGVVLLAVLFWLWRRPADWDPAIHVLIAANFAVTVAITLLFGGTAESAFNPLWGFAALMAGVVVFQDRRVLYWMGVYIVMLITIESISDGPGARYTLDNPGLQGAVTISVVGTFVFVVLLYFVRQRTKLQAESDGLLRNVLPDQIAERLKRSNTMIADQFDEASILFADVVNFTPMSSGMTPAETVELLNEVFSAFDRLVDAAGLEKIKTIGDEYMVAAGVPEPRRDHAHAVAGLSIAMRDHVSSHEIAGRRLMFRMGINSGPVVAGIIGTRKFAYDLWGDAVNTASRMESHGFPGVIQISDQTRRLIEDEFECVEHGTIDVKGKGPVRVWHLVGPKPARPQDHQA